MECDMKLKSLSIILISIFSLSFSGLSCADVNSNLQGFFNGLGYSSNTTSPVAWQGQAAGYYEGGSLFLRSPSDDLQIASINLPSIRAGCGGIDMFDGAFSFINSQALVKFAKNVMSDAIPYAFQLAMATFAPQLKQIFTELQKWAQDINSMNMNSCQIAQDLVGGLWPKHTAAQASICRNLGSQTGIFKDWASARQGCGAGGQGQSSLNAEQKKGGKGITRNTNIVWHQLMKDQMLQKDPQLAEFFMTLSGTVIYDKNGTPHTHPSLIKNRGILQELLSGKTTSGTPPKIYTCTDPGSQSKCLDIAETPMNIDPKNALQYQVEQILISLKASFVSDNALNKEEQGFLNSTSIPVLKFIEVSLESGNQINLLQYSQIIAQDILAKYLDSIIQKVKQDMLYTHFTQAAKQIMNSLAQASIEVQNLKTTVAQKIQALTALIQQSVAYQKMVMGALSDQFKA